MRDYIGINTRARLTHHSVLTLALKAVKLLGEIRDGSRARYRSHCVWKTKPISRLANECFVGVVLKTETLSDRLNILTAFH